MCIRDRNYGARKFNRVKKSVRVCLGMALGVCGSLIVFLMVFCRPLYHIFTTDYSVVDIGVYMLRLITPSYVIFIFVEIFSGALRGIGDVLIPSTITLGGVLLVRLTWILFVTPMTGELSTLLYSYPLAWGATALLLIPYYFHKQKQEMCIRDRITTLNISINSSLIPGANKSPTKICLLYTSRCV